MRAAHGPELIERARSMYREGAPVRAICRATGMGVGTLYYHLDGHSLPGLMAPRLPRRREVKRPALLAMPTRGRQRLAARLWRAAERQALKIEFALTWSHQRREERVHDIQALRELARILRDLAAFEDYGRRAALDPPVEHEQAVAVEGRAVVISRTKRG